MESQLFLFMPSWILLILHWGRQQLDICVSLHVSECDLFSAYFATTRSPPSPESSLKSESESRSVLSDSLQPQGLGILQTRMLEWVAFPFSMGSSQPKNWTQVSCIAGGFFSSWATWEAQIISYFSYISSICARFLLAFGVRRFHMPLIGQVVGRTLENTLQIISEWKYGQSKWFSVISLKMTTINLNLTSEMSVPWMWGSFLYTVRAGKNNT